MSDFDNVSEFADGERELDEATEEDRLTVDSNSPKTMAPTVTIETVFVIRPMKVLAIFCSGLAFMCLILAVAGSEWVEGTERHEGLWAVCEHINEFEISCSSSKSKEWLGVCRTLMFMSLVGSLVGVILGTCGVNSTYKERRQPYYTAAIVVMTIAAIPAIVTLIIFPVKFVEEYQPTSWSIGWSYGIAWVATILLLTGSILLCADRGEEEVRYREQTCYHNESIEEYCD